MCSRSLIDRLHSALIPWIHLQWKRYKRRRLYELVEKRIHRTTGDNALDSTVAPATACCASLVASHPSKLRLPGTPVASARFLTSFYAGLGLAQNGREIRIGKLSLLPKGS